MDRLRELCSTTIQSLRSVIDNSQTISTFFISDVAVVCLLLATHFISLCHRQLFTESEFEATNGEAGEAAEVRGSEDGEGGA